MLNTELTIDLDVLQQSIENSCASVNVEPVNAEAIFNAATRTFTYKDGKKGIRLEAEQTAVKLCERLVKGDFSDFELITSTYDPEYTLSELKANTVKIAEYSSITSNNYNRNNNIQLMCNYVNGIVL